MSTNSEVGAKYRMYFNYDNDKKVYVVPVLPEKIKVTVKGSTTSIDLEKFGEVLYKGRRDAMVISFSSFFPAKWGANYCACMQKEFKDPKTWHKWMIALQNAANPCHFVLTGAPFAIDIYADVTSYSADEQGGDAGTINYTVELKEHRTPTVQKYTVKTTLKKTTTKKTSSGKRTSNKVKQKTYTIKRGDCLWNIAKKYYGSGAKYTKILSANRSTLDKAARKYGYSNCKNGNLIFAGTTIVIP